MGRVARQGLRRARVCLPTANGFLPFCRVRGKRRVEFSCIVVSDDGEQVKLRQWRKEGAWSRLEAPAKPVGQRTFRNSYGGWDHPGRLHYRESALR